MGKKSFSKIKNFPIIQNKEGRRNKFFHSMFIDLGELSIFTGRVLNQFFKPPFEHKELVRQSYRLGNKSLLLVSLTGFIMGLVLSMQIRPILVQLGAQSLIPGIVSIAMFRELGPVITGLICAGKISSGIGAEIGAMKVTEQIDAMEVSGTRPLSYVVASRILAATATVPILVLFADFCGLLGSYFAINFYEPMSFQLYIKDSFDVLSFIDVIPATIKTVVFGFFIGLIGAYKGYNAGLGSDAVGQATNSAVVSASLSIFVIDLVAVLVTNFIAGS